MKEAQTSPQISQARFLGYLLPCSRNKAQLACSAMLRCRVLQDVLRWFHVFSGFTFKLAIYTAGTSYVYAPPLCRNVRTVYAVPTKRVDQCPDTQYTFEMKYHKSNSWRLRHTSYVPHLHFRHMIIFCHALQVLTNVTNDIIP